MASLLYPDEDQSQWPTSLLPVDDGTPPVLQADPRADALATVYQQVRDEMARQQRISADRGLWDDQTGLPTGKGLLDAIQQTGTAVALGTSAPGDAPPPSFINYHGSPHDFPPLPGKPYGAFSDAAIGSGEGAQAYGMGHYTADAEGLARRYRDDVTASKGGAMDYLDATGQRTNYGDLYGRAYDAVSKMEGAVPDIKRAIPRQVLDAVEGGTAPENYMAEYNVDPRYAAHYQAAADALTGVQHSPNKGHMYEVKINADPEHFLDWNKPLDQQHPEVIKAFARLDPDLTDRLAAHAESRGMNSPLEVPEDATGGDLVRMLEHHNVTDAPSEVADILHEAGIPGIRYLDARSRGAGEGSRNSVVFDPATMEIIRKYGLAWLLGGGAAGAAATQGTPQQ